MPPKVASLPVRLSCNHLWKQNELYGDRSNPSIGQIEQGGSSSVSSQTSDDLQHQSLLNLLPSTIPCSSLDSGYTVSPVSKARNSASFFLQCRVDLLREFLTQQLDGRSKVLRQGFQTTYASLPQYIQGQHPVLGCPPKT